MLLDIMIDVSVDEEQNIVAPLPGELYTVKTLDTALKPKEFLD